MNGHQEAICGPRRREFAETFLVLEVAPERPESRIFAIGTADAFTNRLFDMNVDFLRNVFNWAASREYWVSISSRNPDRRILPLGTTDALAKLTRLALWGLPGLCLLLGIVTAWRRSVGGPGTASRRSGDGPGAGGRKGMQAGARA